MLEYQETINSKYYITATGGRFADSKAEQNRRVLERSLREQPFRSYQSSSNETRQGADGKSYEPSANAAEYIYDPVGQARCKMKILGDPAWISQGSVSGDVSSLAFNYGPFLEDGTINPDAGQVLFEIAWQKGQDFDLSKGLADPYDALNRKREAIQSRTYVATRVSSEFRQGRFEQTLQGLLYNFALFVGDAGEVTDNGREDSTTKTSNIDSSLVKPAQVTPADIAAMAASRSLFRRPCLGAG